MANANPIRSDWTKEEIAEIYDLPLMELVYRAQTVHREHHDPLKVQKCTLLSIKTGGCPEDCGYCPQAARYNTGVESEKLLPLPTVVQKAREAKSNGSTRFCMGAAWREVKDGRQFDEVIEMVKAVRGEGLEVCCTLGMLSEEQAQRLKEAGLFAYNHNIDTSEEYYGEVIGTRQYQDRIRTLENVRSAGITMCTGGIVGMGETREDHIAFLQRLSFFDPHPESVPVNALVPVEGTPMGDRDLVDPLVLVRVIASARIIMPKSMVRMSAGRLTMTREAQMLCFMAGANSIFAGDQLLTTPNPGEETDEKLFEAVGVEAMSGTDVPSHRHTEVGA
ncbi:biotin synthase BioB [Sulfidibacter corallicola]|uniref:Biotin synthase n=1 Tax=Sulfidibacter corallicola TaxID=2818388 RepID=A0A8A4TUP4_SULCO|nr:biotin synthase BioB [Sulfidibacter corallicola]QTD52854.1 biotin synthase BioB [Sulfidibacter corallicola]